MLVEEVIDLTKAKLDLSEMDYVSLSRSGATFERDVWAEANQYPLTPGANRMILIRDADSLTRWSNLADWLARTRTLPGVHLVFVSADAKQVATKGPHGKRALPEHISWIKAPRGFIVNCTALKEDDAVAWVRSKAPLDDAMARRLLTRTGGSLGQAAAVCSKLALFQQSAGAAAIDALTHEIPGDSCADNLIALDKRKAWLTIDDLTDDETHKLIAQLDTRLDLLEKLNRIHIAGRTWRDHTGISPFLVRQYLPHARHYDANSCTKRRRLLAVLDNALRNGAQAGVREALVAMW